MKKLIILLLIVLTVTMCSCNSQRLSDGIEDSANTERSLEQTEDTEVVTIDSKEPISTDNEINVSMTPRFFETEQEFVASIKDDPKANSKDQYSLEGIQHYFMPKTAPEGVSLGHIAVKDFYIVFYYQYDQEPDPFWERTFIFEWYRTKKIGDTEMNVKNLYPEEKINSKNNYYIIKMEPTDDYKGDNRYVCQDVYWEQEEYAFHAVVPIWFTQEDIEKYCVAEKVMVK